MSNQHIVVVGAGIVGVASALRAQERGHRVTIVDKQDPGQGASYGNAGVLAAGSIVPVAVPGLWRKLPGMLRDPLGPVYLRMSYMPRMLPWLWRYMRHARADRATYVADRMAPLVDQSREEHEALANGTEAATRIGSVPYAFVFRDRDAFQSDPFGFDLRRKHGMRWREIEGDAVRDAEPALAPHYRFLAVFEAHHAIVDGPGAYVQALADAFAARGGTFQRDEATALERDADGAVTGVRTATGVIAADRVVVACGAWSARLLATIGIHIPLESERGYHVEFVGASVRPNHALMIADGKFVATPMSGRLRAAGLVEFGGLDAPPSDAPVRTLKTRIARVFPGIRYDDAIAWLGHRPALPDGLPAIGEVPGYRHLIVAFGHHHVGLTSGPRTGRIVAVLVSGVRSIVALRAYDPGRFLSGRR